MKFTIPISIRIIAARFLFLFCAISIHAEAEDKPVYSIYLAGPEVFLPEPVAAGEQSKALIEEISAANDWPFELVGLYPLDNEIPDFKPDRDTGLRIYWANIELMDKADFIAANMIRFRGPSMDVGTAFEMGYMRGADKPVFAYYEATPFYGEAEVPGIYSDKVISFFDLEEGATEDNDGQSIENFSMADNLMMIGALESGAAAIAPSLEEAVYQIANYLLAE